MKLRTSVAAALAAGALALALAPSAALAHGGGTPFKNCTEAYKAGHSNIEKGSVHYGPHLDRDKDGVGCDKPPADFVPADDATDEGEDQAEDTGQKPAEPAEQDGGNLAETGGDDMTPYVAAGGAAALLAGAGVLAATRKRRAGN